MRLPVLQLIHISSSDPLEHPSQKDIFENVAFLQPASNFVRTPTILHSYKKSQLVDWRSSSKKKTQKKKRKRFSPVYLHALVE